MSRVCDKDSIKKKTVILLWYRRAVHKSSPKYRKINLLEFPFITLKGIRTIDQESWHHELDKCDNFLMFLTCEKSSPTSFP